jgi:hypothetical protein
MTKKGWIRCFHRQHSGTSATDHLYQGSHGSIILGVDGGGNSSGLATEITMRLNLQNMNFLSDNQELVHFS